MQKTPPTILHEENVLRALDRFIERMMRIADAHLPKQPIRRLDRKVLRKSA